MSEKVQKPLPLGEAFQYVIEELDYYMRNLVKESGDTGYKYTGPFEVRISESKLKVYVRGCVNSNPKNVDGKIGLCVSLLPTEVQGRAIMENS